MNTSAFVAERERRRHPVALALAVLVPVMVGVGLALGLAPDVVRQVLPPGLAAIVVVPDRPPPPPPPPKPRAPKPAGANGVAGKKAVPKPVAAPKARIILAPSPLPQAVSTGAANTSGALAAGVGTGGGNAGNGTGNGSGGEGQGGGSDPVRIAGSIDLSGDFPPATRDLRIGDYVIVAITVSAQGAPVGCRVVRPSRDVEANAVTCRLIMARFRFRPATDGTGRPVAGYYGWKQMWHY